MSEAHKPTSASSRLRTLLVRFLRYMTESDYDPMPGWGRKRKP